MHQPMFDGDPEEFLFFTGDKALIDGVADPPIIAMNLFFLRPIRSPVVRQIATRRVDAEGKQPVEVRVERCHSESAITDKVPIERFHVS